MIPYEDDVINAINRHLPKNDADWELVGFINRKKEIYSFGNDSKIIGRLFEIICYDALYGAAVDLGYKLFESERQTVYPDFYFMKPDGRKIAIDVKTTYRNDKSKFGFTGGSFTSYMRDGKKNIVGKYSDYDGHYILGVVYTREENPTLGKVDISALDSIVPSYKNIDVFVQEKFRICGDKKGSGNTDNIGTIKAASLTPFIYGAGPFSFLGKDVFHDYWVNHPKYKDSPDIKEGLYYNIETYIDWVYQKDPVKSIELRTIYTDYLSKYKQIFSEDQADWIITYLR